MLNKKILLSQAAEIRKSLRRLQSFAKLSYSEFHANSDHFSIAEHHVRKSLEIFFDMGRHIIAREFSEKPADYQDVLKILRQNRVISNRLFKNMENFARFRNRLVHLYWQVSEKEIHEFIKTKAVYLERFCREIITFTRTKKTQAS